MQGPLAADISAEALPKRALLVPMQRRRDGAAEAIEAGVEGL